MNLLIIATFTDPQRATDDLQTFAKMNEKRLYKLLRTAMDPQTDLKTLVKTTVSLLPFTFNLIPCTWFREAVY